MSVKTNPDVTVSKIVPDGKLFGLIENEVWRDFVAMVTQILLVYLSLAHQ